MLRENVAQAAILPIPLEQNLTLLEENTLFLLASGLRAQSLSTQSALETRFFSWSQASASPIPWKANESFMETAFGLGRLKLLFCSVPAKTVMPSSADTESRAWLGTAHLCTAEWATSGGSCCHTGELSWGGERAAGFRAVGRGAQWQWTEQGAASAENAALSSCSEPGKQVETCCRNCLVELKGCCFPAWKLVPCINILLCNLLAMSCPLQV